MPDLGYQPSEGKHRNMIMTTPRVQRPLAGPTPDFGVLGSVRAC